MSNPNDHVGSPKFEPSPSPADVENPMAAEGSVGVTGVLRRWKREDLLRRGSLALRGMAFLFSVLSFIIMATNNHGDWKNFDRYEEYRYLLAISILSSLYTGAQALIKVRELSTGKFLFKQSSSLLFDFCGDQIDAYLLLSAASSAVPLTNRMRESQDNIFTDTSASSISMAFLAFFTLALSALLSGFKLSNQSYI
ncbi:hypothetical protein G4B88_001554 [Cannabis sativa]|uniref:CASP-like protein n=1 Tax=Cannabis sativa TaxID=3483 RepID=A0A7J6I3Y3_CANSA|nr:hypothetical protein G4B88_001554 [Cannabis sativa]